MSTDAPVFAHAFPSLALPTDGKADRSHAQGHAAGYAAGMRAAVAEVSRAAAAQEAELVAFQQRQLARTDQAVRSLEAAAQALTARVVLVDGASQQLVQAAALDLAEAIVGAQLRSDDPARLALKRALRDVDPDDVRRVRLSPADWASLDEQTRTSTGVTLVADPTLATGDAMVDLADGYLDARIGTALVRARQALQDPA